jgi:hypothetical protein
MTPRTAVPELITDNAIVSWLSSRCVQYKALTDLERNALVGRFDDPFLQTEPWLRFSERTRAMLREHDHVIIRNVPELGGGASLILASLTLSQRFKQYRGDKIVKHFRMSPWTTDLSHTLKEGEFHTDINTAPEPPVLTAIQCKVPDPGTPRYGELRVARLIDILYRLRSQNAIETLAFLQDANVTMVNEMAPGGWTGRIVSGGRIRFHPETLRAGQRRYGTNPPDLEEHLKITHEAALAVSTPIHLNAGEVLLVSNTRALHYRGACSVIFHTFPRLFTSREVYVLHLLDEPV